jgi:hypothetical protein
MHPLNLHVGFQLQVIILLHSLNVKAVVAWTFIISLWNVTSMINNISFTMGCKGFG